MRWKEQTFVGMSVVVCVDVGLSAPDEPLKEHQGEEPRHHAQQKELDQASHVRTPWRTYSRAARLDILGMLI